MASREIYLFENHLSDYPTGCPKFIEATPELRKSLVAKIKFCRQCFNPAVIFTRDHIDSCPVKNRNNMYTCKNSTAAHVDLSGA